MFIHFTCFLIKGNLYVLFLTFISTVSKKDFIFIFFVNFWLAMILFWCKEKFECVCMVLRKKIIVLFERLKNQSNLKATRFNCFNKWIIWWRRKVSWWRNFFWWKSFVFSFDKSAKRLFNGKHFVEWYVFLWFNENQTVLK